MKMPSSKVIAIAIGGLLAVGGIALALELTGNEGRDANNIGRERGRDTDARRGRTRPAASDHQNVPGARTSGKACPDEKTVEDNTIKADPEFIKTRFSNKICSKSGSGQITACQDADQKVCDERVNPPTRRSRSPVQCVNRPTEVYCSSHKLSTDTLVTTCFDVKSECDAFHEKKHTLPRVCRLPSACEHITLPPL